MILLTIAAIGAENPSGTAIAMCPFPRGDAHASGNQYGNEDASVHPSAVGPLLVFVERNDSVSRTFVHLFVCAELVRHGQGPTPLDGDLTGGFVVELGFPLLRCLALN